MLIPSTRHARRTRAYISTRYIPPPSSQSNPDRRLYAVPFWSATAGSTGRFSGGLLRRRSQALEYSQRRRDDNAAVGGWRQERCRCGGRILRGGGMDATFARIHRSGKFNAASHSQLSAFGESVRMRTRILGRDNRTPTRYSESDNRALVATCLHLCIPNLHLEC